MNIFEAIIQGIVQGATEFLPVSSSGHLSISQHVMGINLESLLFDVLLHIGTLIAVVFVYRKLICRLIIEFFRTVRDIFKGNFKFSEMSDDRRLLVMLVIGLLPLFILFIPIPGTGMKIKDLSDLWATDSNILVEGLSLIATSILLFTGIHMEKISKGGGRKKLKTGDALTMGFAQCMAALLPGLSRSGSTLSVGLMKGVNKQTALDYSFVMGIPAILAAAVLSVGEALHEPIDLSIGVMIAGVVTSAIVGLLAIKLLKWIVSSNKLNIFAYYTLIVGAITVVISIIEFAVGHNIFTNIAL